MTKAPRSTAKPRTMAKATAKTATAKSKPPSKRGIRGQKTVDRQQGFREYLEALLLERPRLTLDEMLDRIKGSGWYISRSTLARYGLEFALRRQKAAQIIEMAKAFAHDDSDAILSLEKAASQLALTKLFDSLLETEGVDEDTLAKMQTVARLQASGAARERVILAHNKGVKAAATLIKSELQGLLKRKHPELLAQLIQLVDASSRKLLQEAAS